MIFREVIGDCFFQDEIAMRFDDLSVLINIIRFKFFNGNGGRKGLVVKSVPILNLFEISWRY